MKKKKIRLGDLMMDVIIYALLIVIFVIMLYPVWYVVVASLTTSAEVALSGGLLLWPKKFVSGAYELVFQNGRLMTGFRNSILIELISLPLNIILTLITGYFMASTNVMWKKPVVMMMMLTMYFSGGMIPTYLNIRSMGLLDTIWALVLPGVVSVYRCLICKTSIEAIPASLPESAFIDGANDFQVIWHIIMPLIKATIAVLLLYYGVDHWNAWFQASIYLRTDTWVPVSNVLRSMLIENTELTANVAGGDSYDTYAETIKYAAIVVSTLPIMCIYPFLQKYFAKGALVGAVKG